MIPRQLLIVMIVLLLGALGLSIYALRMRGRVAQVTSSPEDARPVTPPVSGPTERVTLSVAWDDAGALHSQPATIPLPSARQQRAEEILRALLRLYQGPNSPHAIPSGSEVRAVYLVDPGLAVIDLNSAFANGHRSGVLEEELTIASLIRTLAENIPGISRVKILIDGKERDTLAGHADLTSIYDVDAVNALVTQMQSP
jgi:hypothetical protein